METHDETTEPVGEKHEVAEKHEDETVIIDEAKSAQTEEAPADGQGLEAAPSVAALSDEELRSVVEVLLLVSDRPLSVSRLREVLEGVSPEKVEETIGHVQKSLTESGFPFQLREVAGGYVLSTLPKYAPWVRKMYSPKITASKLSRAALETLAVIAYKQPVTRAEVEAIRGVNVDGTTRTLLDKHLVEIVGYKDVVGKPATYGTTSEFLLHFGLKSLSELPSIEELRQANPNP
jgi:segregation and condensation protein B